MPWKESRTMASYCDRDEIKAAVEVVQAASTQNECQTAYVPPPKVSADRSRGSRPASRRW
jgi:hypothetical protein